MNDRRVRREQLDLTQHQAATRAGVSLATWRRWEEDPTTVRKDTQAKCEKVLDRESHHRMLLAEGAARIEGAWGDSEVLTPRQASAVAAVLEFWADTDIDQWLRDGTREPLHDVEPFASFDLRVMVYVNDNRAWAAKAAERCYAVANEIEHGMLPFDRPGCYFDELLIGAALPAAKAQLDDMPELFDDIVARPPSRPTDEDGFHLFDEDWDLVSDQFDDRCRWDEWEVPLYKNHPLLGAVLAERHPYTWFDPSEGSGAGYLQRLAGLIVEQET